MMLQFPNFTHALDLHTRSAVTVHPLHHHRVPRNGAMQHLTVRPRVASALVALRRWKLAGCSGVTSFQRSRSYCTNLQHVSQRKQLFGSDRVKECAATTSN